MSNRHAGDIPPLEAKRRGLFLKVAEDIERYFGLDRTCGRVHPWDVDECAAEINMTFPSTESEMIEAWEQVETTKLPHRSTTKESPFVRLRRALNITDPKVSVVQVIEAAIERLAAHKPLADMPRPMTKDAYRNEAVLTAVCTGCNRYTACLSFNPRTGNQCGLLIIDAVLVCFDCYFFGVRDYVAPDHPNLIEDN